MRSNRLLSVGLFFCCLTATLAAGPTGRVLGRAIDVDPEANGERMAEILIFSSGGSPPEGQPIFSHEFANGYPSDEELRRVLAEGAAEVRIVGVRYDAAEVARILRAVEGPYEDGPCTQAQARDCDSGCANRQGSNPRFVLTDVHCHVEGGSAGEQNHCTCVWTSRSLVARTPETDRSDTSSGNTVVRAASVSVQE